VPAVRSYSRVMQRARVDLPAAGLPHQPEGLPAPDGQADAVDACTVFPATAQQPGRPDRELLGYPSSSSRVCGAPGPSWSAGEENALMMSSHRAGRRLQGAGRQADFPGRRLAPPGRDAIAGADEAGRQPARGQVADGRRRPAGPAARWCRHFGMQ